MQTKQATMDEARLSAITCGPLPASRKVYLPGTLYPFLRVPMREIAQTPTQQHGASGNRRVDNPPVTVYDTSGPYTDPSISIDVREGMAPLRRPWIEVGLISIASTVLSC